MTARKVTPDPNPQGVVIDLALLEIPDLDFPGYFLPTFVLDRPSEAPPGPVEEPDRRPHLSPSQLKSWTGCGYRFYLEHVAPPENRPAPVPAWALIGGTAVHRTFDDVVVDGLKGKPDVAARAFQHYLAEGIIEAMEVEPDRSKWRASGRKSKIWPNKEDRDWWRQEGEVMARRFAILYDSEFLPGRVVVYNDRPLVEVEFLVMMGGQPVKGYIDAVIETPDGEIIPRDYKSGSRAEKDGRQLATYAVAMQELYGVLPTRGEYLGTRKMQVDAWPLAELVDNIGGQYAQLAKAKEVGLYIARPSELCASCTVAFACPFKAPTPGGADDE